MDDTNKLFAGGVGEIAEERKRQIEAENYSTAHDDKHRYGELAAAAMVYAANDEDLGAVDYLWPWQPEENKREKHSRIRQLVIAGALIAAEIDRLRRLEQKGGE
jgi:predicted RNase H-like nuclease (RuvC/YqgF family)